MKMETQVFNDVGLGRRLIRMKVFRRIPLVPLMALLVAGLVAAAILVGPPSQNENQSIAMSTPQINGLNTNPLYGDILGGTQFSFTVTVFQNSYKIGLNMRPAILVRNLTAGTDIVMQASTNGITYPFTNPSFTQNGSTFTYDFGTGLEQLVAAGATNATAPTWYFQFHYAVTQLPADVITWNAQFVNG